MDLIKFMAKTAISTIRSAKTLNPLSKVWLSSKQTEIKYSEEMIKKILENRFSTASSIKVIDMSGGCGAMFDIFIESKEFKGLPIVKQHRAVNEALKNEIKNIHGLRISTSTPKD